MGECGWDGSLTLVFGIGWSDCCPDEVCYSYSPISLSVPVLEDVQLIFGFAIDIQSSMTCVSG